MIEEYRPVDTNRFFVICSNYPGGCMETTGPASEYPGTGKPCNLSFPVVSVHDMARAQAMLPDQPGIDNLFCVSGGPKGGMQVPQWVAGYPERVFAAVPVATSASHSARNIALHEIGRQAIRADPQWLKGSYRDHGTKPGTGLAVARRIFRVAYFSERKMHRKFERNLHDRDDFTWGFDANFQIESHLRHPGSTFVERFDANSYLCVTRAMDCFDFASDCNGIPANAFRETKARVCLVSFTRDRLFPTAGMKQVPHALDSRGANLIFSEIESANGHDAFLLEVPRMSEVLRGFLDAATRDRGLL